MAKGTPEKTKRNKSIIKFRKAGMSFRKLGRVFGISAARAKQLCDRKDKRYKDTTQSLKRPSIKSRAIKFKADRKFKGKVS